MKNILFILFSFALTYGCAAGKADGRQPQANVTGKVQSIDYGKDGYTAQVLTDGGQVFFATVSRANLADPQQYREIKVGETIQVKGEQWKGEKGMHITVREFFILKG